MRHSIAPKHDPHQLEKAKFAHFVAGEASKVAAEGMFDALVLVAPAHCLREIEDGLDLPRRGDGERQAGQGPCEGTPTTSCHHI